MGGIRLSDQQRRSRMANLREYWCSTISVQATLHTVCVWPVHFAPVFFCRKGTLKPNKTAVSWLVLKSSLKKLRLETCKSLTREMRYISAGKNLNRLQVSQNTSIGRSPIKNIKWMRFESSFDVRIFFSTSSLLFVSISATVNALRGMNQPVPDTMHRGHIPGSRNIQLNNFVDPNTNCFRPPEEIAAGELKDILCQEHFEPKIYGEMEIEMPVTKAKQVQFGYSLGLLDDKEEALWQDACCWKIFRF